MQQNRQNSSLMQSIESIINHQYFSDDEVKNFISSCFIPRFGPLKQMKRDLVERSVYGFIRRIDERIQDEIFKSDYPSHICNSVKENHSYRDPMNRLIYIMMDMEKKTDNVNKPFKFWGSLVRSINPFDYITKIITAASISITVSCIKESLIEYYHALLLGKSEEEALDLFESSYKHLFYGKVLSIF